MTFEQYVADRYAKNVDEIRLEVAMQWQANQTGYTGGTAVTAWQMADEFIEVMRERWESKPRGF